MSLFYADQPFFFGSLSSSISGGQAPEKKRLVPCIQSTGWTHTSGWTLDGQASATHASAMFDSLCFFSASDWHGITYQGGGMGGQHGFAGCYDNVSFSVPWPPPPVLILSCIATEDFSRPRSLSLFSPSFFVVFQKVDPC